jgi:hypothetical protein
MPAALTLKTLPTRDVPALAPRRSASQVPSNPLSSLIDAFGAWRQRRLEAEIGEFIERRGGRITDDLERQISHRLR